ncbi:MAG: TspO/MBR family protein [Bacteroidota bacterium]
MEQRTNLPERSGTASIISLIIWLAICFGVAYLGAMVSPGIASSDWYDSLRKPVWRPPNWLFGPVWTTLYTMMAVAMWLVWRKVRFAIDPLPYYWFGIQLILNLLWSWLFFKYHWLGLATLEILLLWISISITMYLFYRYSNIAAALMIPYLLWVTFASILCGTIWFIN